MSDPILTVSISWIPIMKVSALLLPVLLVQATKLTTTRRTSWIENNIIPDSISMNIVGRSLLRPVAPKIRSSGVGLTSWNTLKILNTIKLVTTAFTTMETARPVMVSVILQWGTEAWSCTRYRGATPPAIQMTRGIEISVRVRKLTLQT